MCHKNVIVVDGDHPICWIMCVYCMYFENWELVWQMKNNRLKNDTDLVCISRLYDNVYIGWMNKVIMADGEDMIITWSRPREPLVRRHSVRTNVLIDVQERATHVKNIEWSRRSLSIRVNIYFLLVWMYRWPMDWMMYQASCSLDDGITHPTFGLGNVNSTKWISTLRGGNTTVGLCVF